MSVIGLTSLVSCVAIVPPSKVNESFADAISQRDLRYQIQPGDTISIRFFNQVPNLDQTFLVLPDGRCDPFFMDNTIVAGKTVRQFQDDVERFYTNEVRDPEISVEIQPVGELIYLDGQVQRPATQAYTLKMTLSQALSNAGGQLLTGSDDVLLRRPYQNPSHPEKFWIDLGDDSEEIFLLPNDHIVVYRTGWILARDYFVEYVLGWVSPLFQTTRYIAFAGI